MTFVTKRAAFAAIMAAGVVAASLAGCNRDNTSNSGSGQPAAAKRACVILPDAASSPRWENGDRPHLRRRSRPGFEADIQNAQGDTDKYATIADQQLTKGCGVMLLVDLNGAGVQVAEKAKAQGIPVIAYDRPIAGADYYVSFDNVKVGELEGQMIVDGLKAAGKDPATAKVVYIGGDPTDGNAEAVPRRRRRGHGGGRHQAGVRAAGHVGRRQVRHQLRAGATPRSAARSTQSGSPTTPTLPVSSRSSTRTA